MGSHITVLLCTAQLATNVSWCPPTPSSADFTHPAPNMGPALSHHAENASDHASHGAHEGRESRQVANDGGRHGEFAHTAWLMPVCACGCSEPGKARTPSRANGDALLGNFSPRQERAHAAQNPPDPASAPTPLIESIDHVPILFA
ncbi:hypothetical protein MK489_02635 [Myxococcota bacterium]|nr:hypothetical protein [Myxococcota bacterium]